MAQAAHVLPPPAPMDSALAFRFHSLILTDPESLARPRGLTLTLSLLLHATLLSAVILIPILWNDVLPVPDAAVRAFFVTPADVTPPPPPPPPPPAAGVRSLPRAPAAPRLPEAPTVFTAPIEVPNQVRVEEALDLGIEGGVAGGVEGGVPGGVVGGIVGGLPSELPPPPVKVVRVGGALVAPKLVHSVKPEYPPLATQSRLQGIVVLEAQVDVSGRVKSVHILRGVPLLQDAAVEAVKQWRYQPLLLNGEPTEFILTVTLIFHLADAGVRQ